VDASQVDGSQVDRPEVDGSQVDGTQVDGSQVDRTQVDGSQVDPPQVDGSQVDRTQVDGSQVDAQEPGPEVDSTEEHRQKAQVRRQAVADPVDWPMHPEGGRLPPFLHYWGAMLAALSRVDPSGLFA
ncbi:MAG TPA: hypothetical protein VEM41_12580, partial [Actinomycetota bacterium]|nr:hypothetical protein [Actinomycetota bacterium]